jgi:hypothetical protein
MTKIIGDTRALPEGIWAYISPYIISLFLEGKTWFGKPNADGKRKTAVIIG